MGKVVFDTCMSLDGFMTASNPRPQEPLGDGGGGQRLQEWVFGADVRGRELLERAVGGTGAVIAGRRTYDRAVSYWGADGPTASARLPLFVVSHAAPDDVPEGGVYTFVGTRMFEHIGSAPIQLEIIEVVEAAAATHLRYRVHGRSAT
jgi:hypothetical protein